MTFKNLFWLTLFYALIAGLINLYFWIVLPDGAQVLMLSSSGEGKSEYAPVINAIFIWPAICFYWPLWLWGVSHSARGQRAVGRFLGPKWMENKGLLTLITIIWSIFFVLLTWADVDNLMHAKY